MYLALEHFMTITQSVDLLTLFKQNKQEIYNLRAQDTHIPHKGTWMELSHNGHDPCSCFPAPHQHTSHLETFPQFDS